MSENNEQTTALAPRPPSIEELRYREELAEKMGLPSPYGMNLVKSLAEDLVHSGMVPTCWRANPMAIFLAVMRGREMDLAPMESVLETFWAAPGGRLGMYAGKMLTIMSRNGVRAKFIKETPEECEILFTPPIPYEPYTARFHISEAMTAGLVKTDSNWLKWPTDMCRSRSISRGWRALSGTFGKSSANLYSKEELEDIDDTPGRDQRVADAASNGGTSDFKVSVKPKASETVVEMPSQAAQAAEAPITHPEPAGGAAPAASSQADPPPQQTVVLSPTYEIHVVMPVAGEGEPKQLLCEGERATTQRGTAQLRATALANTTGLEHRVVAIDPETSAQTVVYSATPPPKAAPRPPAPENAAKAESRKRLEALAVALDIPVRTAMARFNAFFSGYLGLPIKDLGKAEDSAAQMALASLESTIAIDAEEFRAGPEECGRRKAEQEGETLRFLAGQYAKNPEVVALGVALARQWSLGSKQFKTWFDAIGLDFMPVVDGHALLRIALQTREVAKLAKACSAHNLSIASALQQIEERALLCKVEKAPAAQIDKAIEAFVADVKAAATDTSSKGKAAAPPAPVAAPAPPPPAEPDGSTEDEGGGLFSSEFGGE